MSRKLRNFLRTSKIIRSNSSSAVENSEGPTPEKFVLYLLSSAESFPADHRDGAEEFFPPPHGYFLDSHFKPLWASAPFCQVDFDALATVENFHVDSAKIIRSLELQKYLDPR